MNAENELPQSVRHYQEQQAQEQVERENREKFQSVWNDVRHFTSDKPDDKFYCEWTRRILVLADELKSEGLAEHLDALDSQAESELVRDGFRDGVKIYRAAMAGNESEVETRLKTTATAPQVFSGAVGNAIRRDIVEMLQSTKWPERFTVDNVHLPKPKPQTLMKANAESVVDETNGKPEKKKYKKSSEQKDTGAKQKIIAALLNWHRYESGSVLNDEPVGVNELGSLSGTSGSSATRFFKKQFGGYKKYKWQCRNRSTLQSALGLLNGDFPPAMLSGGKAKEIASYDPEPDMDK